MQTPPLVDNEDDAAVLAPPAELSDARPRARAAGYKTVIRGGVRPRNDHAARRTRARPPAYTMPTPRGPVVFRPLWLRLLGVGGIIHASAVLMTLVVLAVIWLGGDSRIALVTTAIRGHGAVLWTWTLFASATSFVLALRAALQRDRHALAFAVVATHERPLVGGVARAGDGRADRQPRRRLPAAEERVARAIQLRTPAGPDLGHILAGIAWPALVLFTMSTRRVKNLYARIADGAAMM
jgi:hypothetical protein